jgi:Flp pilus assembly protein TadG
MGQSTKRAAIGFARDESAQGVIEFALIVTILLLIALGTFDYARFLYYQRGLTTAVRVGAEYASNHCYQRTTCGQTNTATPDLNVMWATSCESLPYISLTPTYQSCDPYQTVTCSSTSCSSCTADICVTPSTRSTGTAVTVTVGYSFKPISFLIAPFFTEHSCFTGDTTSVNHHTLCASAVGRVS